MFKLLNNLSIRNRMALSIVLFLMTLGYALYDAVITANIDIDFAKQERVGAFYQEPVGELLYHTVLLNIANISNDKSSFADRLSDVQKDQDQFKSVHTQYEQVLGLTADKMKQKGKDALHLSNLQTEWSRLANTFSTADKLVLESSLDDYATHIKDLISYSGDASNLTLDPDLDSYYMMDAAVLGLPQALVHLSDASLEILKFSQNNASSNDAIIALAIKANLVKIDAERVKNSIETAIIEDKNFNGATEGLEDSIKPALAAYLANNDAYLSLIDSMIHGQAVNESDVASAAKKTVDSAYSMMTTTAQGMSTIIAQREEALVTKKKEVLVISLVGILVALIFYTFVVLSLIKPLRVLVNHMKKLTNNELDGDVPFQSARSEVGDIAKAVQVFKLNALENKRLEDDKIAAEARAAADKKEAMAMLASNFKGRIQGIISSVAAASTELAHTAEAMSKTIYESNTNVQDAVSNTVETYQSVQSVAVSAEEMSATIQEISLQTQNASGLISESVDMVKGADTHANELRSASQKVKNVIQLISNISSQINLLALNATIESARAGEAGKGFAVVANEVRNLAGQTDKSIQDIEKVIADMSHASDDVIGSLGTIKDSVDKIYISSCGIASAVEEQSAVMNDISQNMNLATVKTQTVKENVTMAGNLSSEAETSSQQVLMAAQDLSRQAEQLDQEVANFLNDIVSG